MNKQPKPKNLVAKFAHMFNRSSIIDDKQAYNRKQKHKKPPMNEQCS